MKVAKACAQTVTFDCPTCFEPIATPDGSLFWPVNELWGNYIKCLRCNSKSLIPREATL
jgi:hypothetical protein